MVLKRLLTEEEHQEILNILGSNPILTFQNKGYTYIPKSSLSDDDIDKIKKIEGILDQIIGGFSSFTNFRINPNGDSVIRFQYDYNYKDYRNGGFIGVGYITVRELKNGFDV